MLATAAPGPGTTGLSFFNSSIPKLTQEANAVATADFNGDGIPDLAVSDSNSGQVLLAILLGNGDRTFTATATSPTVGLYPDSIAVADFNSDGKADLAVTSVDQVTVTILLGNGDGTFTAAPTLDTNGTPQSIAAGDFNFDGIPDLAVVNGESVSIFLGNGDGTFAATSSNPIAGSQLDYVAVGDFNGDGILDLVVTNASESGFLTILLGKGDGTFAALPTTSVGTSPVWVTVADFNGDGILDLAVADYDAGASSTPLTILLGNGDGTFKANEGPSVPGLNFKQIVVSDFNQDGIADLAVGEFWHGLLGICLGKGDGTFSAGIAESAESQLGSGYLAAADFNGDGILDLAVPSQDGVVPILLTQPTQTVTATVTNFSPVGPGPVQVFASYPGDANYVPSISSATALIVQVATPVISPAAGTYTSSQTVTISDATAGATIYYQASGGSASSGFVQYTGPITISQQGYQSIQAYATATGYQQSTYASVTYNLNLPPTAAPVLSLAAGVYPGAQTVSISDSASAAVIYYTTNGSLPTTSSTRYSGPINVSTSETLVAVAVANGYSMSTPVSAQYIIGSSASSFIYTLAGNGFSGYAGDGGPAVLANLNYPNSTVVDSAGNLYMADATNNVIRRVAAGTGIITTIAGTGVSGYSGDNGAATSAQLNVPTGPSLDGADDLYFSDELNHRVRMIAAATGVITTVAGNGTPGYSGDGNTAVNAQLQYPNGTVVDSAGNLYIADTSNSRIREVAAKTGIITTFAGSGLFGYAGDGGPANAAEFESPEGVAVDSSGNVYIADTDNQVVRKVTAGTGVISTVAGVNLPGPDGGGYSGDGGPATSAEFRLPTDVALDSAGNLYIADSNNQVIRKVTASTGLVNTVAGNGNGTSCTSFAGDGGPAASAALCFPMGISFDRAGNLYIADNGFDRIRVVTAAALPPNSATAAPVVSVAAGTYPTPQTVTITDATPGASIYITTNGAASSTSASGYNGPIKVSGSVTVQAVALAPGHLTSAPLSAAYTITSPPTTVIKTVAGNGVSGFTGAGGPATSAQIGHGYSHGDR